MLVASWPFKISAADESQSAGLHKCFCFTPVLVLAIGKFFVLTPTTVAEFAILLDLFLWLF